MRYHHGHDCHGHGGYHGHCGPGLEYGPAYGFGRDPGYSWDATGLEPLPRGPRSRAGWGIPARRFTANQLEGYLASLRDEMRAIEQDLRDLRATDGGPLDKPEA